MSHFTCYVLVPKDTPFDAFQPYLDRVFEPFNENREVSPYPEKCWCVGSVERRRIYAAVEAAYPNPNDDDALWSARRAMQARLLEDPNNAALCAPEADCEECHGTGIYQSTYNPESKWDWWRVGGRWDGAIQGERRDDGDGGFNFGPEHQELRNNVIRSEPLKKQIHTGAQSPPFSMLTLDGKWHESGKMGWWAMVSDEKGAEVWRETVVELLDQAGDCWVVACDLHI